jgi:hypothetical protein
MKDINNLEDLKRIMRTCSYWGDEWTLTYTGKNLEY